MRKTVIRAMHPGICSGRGWAILLVFEGIVRSPRVARALFRRVPHDTSQAASRCRGGIGVFRPAAESLRSGSFVLLPKRERCNGSECRPRPRISRRYGSAAVLSGAVGVTARFGCEGSRGRFPVASREVWPGISSPVVPLPAAPVDGSLDVAGAGRRLVVGNFRRVCRVQCHARPFRGSIFGGIQRGMGLPRLVVSVAIQPDGFRPTARLRRGSYLRRTLSGRPSSRVFRGGPACRAIAALWFVSFP